MKHSVIVLLLHLVSLVDYSQNSMEKVKHFFSSNPKIHETLSVELGNNECDEAMSIVAPEISFYSSISDKVETYTLKVLYAQTGRGDFSIGYFQMKPTFAEHIESIISNDKKLKLKYHNLLINEETPQAERAERISRLSSLKYQTLYLAAFYEIASIKVSNWKSSYTSTIQRLKNLATLYNAGLHISESVALNLQTKKQFPSISTEKVNYSCLVVEYYHTLHR